MPYTVSSLFPMGLFDYNDLATATTPLSIVGAAAAVDVPNDGAGPFTNIQWPPRGVTRVWDGTDFRFDELSLGDTMELRFDADLITTTQNTEIEVEWVLAIGGTSYTLPLLTGRNFKVTGTYHLTRFQGLYIGDANTRDNKGRLKISADKNCSLVVHGWYCKVHRR